LGTKKRIAGATTGIISERKISIIAGEDPFEQGKDID
jgi:hypothetical protein